MIQHEELRRASVLVITWRQEPPVKIFLYVTWWL